MASSVSVSLPTVPTDRAITPSEEINQKAFNKLLDGEHIEKILKIARTSSDGFPHRTEIGGTSEYMFEPLTWWTSGFFPGSLWALIERSKRYSLPSSSSGSYDDLEELAEKWKNKLEPSQYNTNTHDIGFLIMPAYWRDFKINNNQKSADIIVQSAKSLMTRWNDNVKMFRSWNTTKAKDVCFDNKDRDYLVIIDNMMNLDLLYAASIITGDSIYAQRATEHADQTLKYHVRPDNSTYHLIVLDPETGTRKVGLTHQGYRHESAWSRGQAWALYGFATVYQYTKDQKYLDAAKKLSDYFISRLENGIVYWDFDAPRPCEWDTSAAMIACSGMLLICQLQGNTQYLSVVYSMIKACEEGALTNKDSATILAHSTVDNNENSLRRNADTGLVYADYYFLEVGNRLLEMGLIGDTN